MEKGLGEPLWKQSLTRRLMLSGTGFGLKWEWMEELTHRPATDWMRAREDEPSHSWGLHRNSRRLDLNAQLSRKETRRSSGFPRAQILVPERRTQESGQGQQQQVRAGWRRWPAGKQPTTGFPWCIYCPGRFQATNMKSLDRAGKRCEVARPCRVFPGHSDSKMQWEYEEVRSF